MDKICCFCKFWGSRFKGELYRFRENENCQRHAPTVRITTDSYMQNKPLFPQTKGNDFCGDFEDSGGVGR